MDEMRFWAIVTKWKLDETVATGRVGRIADVLSKDGMEHYMQRVRVTLNDLTVDEGREVALLYSLKWAHLDHKDLRTVHSLVSFGGTDGDWSDIRFYIVGLGERVFESVRQRPEQLAVLIRVPGNDSDWMSELMCRYVLGSEIGRALNERHRLSKEEFRAVLGQRPIPSGDEYKEGEGISQFPEIARRYGLIK